MEKTHFLNQDASRIKMRCSMSLLWKNSICVYDKGKEQNPKFLFNLADVLSNFIMMGFSQNDN